MNNIEKKTTHLHVLLIQSPAELPLNGTLRQQRRCPLIAHVERESRPIRIGHGTTELTRQQTIHIPSFPIVGMEKFSPHSNVRPFSLVLPAGIQCPAFPFCTYLVRLKTH